MIKYNNQQDKAFDKATFNPAKASSDSVPVSSNLDMRIDLELESWAKNKEEKCFNHNKIPEKQTIPKDFNVDSSTKLR